jgi:diaminohydroxyphosphoribosylaminopyrimidine deaminase/5-amino-6-(5-phosphoribosylamino)uracil reductase
MNKKYMFRAIELAKKGIGKTKPNPPVGAVIVKNDVIIGEGYHKKAGDSHAEIAALRQAKKKAKGADLYVTLEPCSSQGKTPPCIDQIIASGIKRVFIGSVDPNIKNREKSFRILKENNIFYEAGVLKEKTDELIMPFCTFIKKKRPMYIMKTAITLDARIASDTGDSKWITNEKSRKFVHKLRNYSDAILIGKNTLIKDNPELTVRGIKGHNNPYKVILGLEESMLQENPLNPPCQGDSLLQENPLNPPCQGDSLLQEPPLNPLCQGDSLFQANIFKENKDKVLFFVRDEKIYEKYKDKFNIYFIKDLNDLSRELYKLNIMSVLIEGGAKIYKSFLQAGLIDKFYFFIAPKIIGGENLCLETSFKISDTMKGALNLKNVKIKQFDDNVCVIASIASMASCVHSVKVSLCDNYLNGSS